jgi:hypothetical protein
MNLAYSRFRIVVATMAMIASLYVGDQAIKMGREARDGEP